MTRLTLINVAKEMKLEVLAGHEGLNREIKVDNVARPGVEIAGYLDFFDPERICLIGSKEAGFLKMLPKKTQIARMDGIFKLNPPAIIISVNVEVKPYLIELADKYKVPLLKSSERTTPLSSRLYGYLHSMLAPRYAVHGVLMDISGLGTLIIGKSGIGKSETALELIKRGHILIADDRVDIYETVPGVVIGQAPKVLERYIEIRGIGIVDVVHMFGVGAFRENKKIRLVVELELWDKEKQYDRLGLETQTVNFFNTEIPKMTIPILPGRNNAILVESAATNQKLKYLGYNAATTLVEKINQLAERKEDNE